MAKKLINILGVLAICFVITIFILYLSENNISFRIDGSMRTNFITMFAVSIITTYLYFGLSDRITSRFTKEDILKKLSYAAVTALLFLGTANYFAISLCKWLIKDLDNPFYMPSGAILGLVTLTVSQVIILNIRFFIKTLKEGIEARNELEKMKQEVLTAQYNALQAQLNPHFLFNSLTALIGMMEEKSDMAIPFTMHLSKIYRYVLQHGQKESVTLEEEMYFVENLWYLHKARLKDALEVCIKINEKHLQHHIPPLSLQLLLENALKHNTVSANKPLHIQIESVEDKDAVSLTVSNNLQEKHSVHSNCQGLANLNKRCLYLTGKGIITNKTPEQFTVKIPLLKK